MSYGPSSCNRGGLLGCPWVREGCRWLGLVCPPGLVGWRSVARHVSCLAKLGPCVVWSDEATVDMLIWDTTHHHAILVKRGPAMGVDEVGGRDMPCLVALDPARRSGVGPSDRRRARDVEVAAVWDAEVSASSWSGGARFGVEFDLGVGRGDKRGPTWNPRAHIS
jgi:hypothetical protein